MDKINWWKNELDESDILAVSASIRQRCVSQGDVTEEFEKKLADFLKVPYTICVSSGSAALAVSYIACGLKGSDSFITSNLTFVATANAGLLLGANVIAVDVNKKGVIDVNCIERSITKNTKLLVPVHMNGVVCDMDVIVRIAKQYDLEVVEDACQAFGSKDSKGRFLGSVGRFGCFSLGMAKILTTGGGGFIVAHNKDDSDLLKRIRNQGVFDVRKESNYERFGFNFKFTDLQASIGINQLQNIHLKLDRSRAIYDRYKNRLGRYFEFLESHTREIPMRVVVLSEKNREIFNFLLKRDIVCAIESPPLNQCSFLNIEGEFPVSEYFQSRKLILPSGPSRTFDEIDRVCDAIDRYFR